MWAVLVVKNDFVIVITNSINIIDIIINHVVIINRVVKLVFSSHKIPIKYFIIVVIGRCKFFTTTYSRLNEIILCDRVNVCTKPLTFGYKQLESNNDPDISDIIAEDTL
jgi:hypothetical protein